MKKIIILLLFSLFFIVPKGAAETTDQYVEIIRTTKIYDQIAGEQVIVGYLIEGESYQLLSEDEKYYYISFGNGKAHFKKEYGKTTNLLNKQNTNQPNSNLVVITKHPTTVYDSTTNQQKSFAVINRNIRYPVIGKQEKYYKIDVGNRIGYIHEGNVNIDLGIPVLMYHHMLENPENTIFNNNSMVIKVAAFEQQMKYLHDQGYRTIHLQDLENYLMHRQNFTGKVAVITFDDGLLSTVHYAYPILKKYQFKATQFLIVAKVLGHAPLFNENSLQNIGYKEINETSDIYDYQSHTVGLHLREPSTNAPYMIIKNFNEVKEDLIYSKNLIGAHYKTPDHVKYLAYPFGQYDQEAINAAVDAGFRLAFTTETGNVKLGDDKFKLKRQGISPSHNMNDFIKKLAGTY